MNISNNYSIRKGYVYKALVMAAEISSTYRHLLWHGSCL